MRTYDTVRATLTDYKQSAAPAAAVIGRLTKALLVDAAV